jgi:hypothetical protein
MTAQHVSKPAKSSRYSTRKPTATKKGQRVTFLRALTSVRKLLTTKFEKPKHNSKEFAKVGGTMFRLLAGARQPYYKQQQGQRGKSKKELKLLLGHLGVTPYDLLVDFIPESAMDKYQKSLFETTR